MSTNTSFLLAAAVALAAVPASCGWSGGSESEVRTLRVAAASSLTDVFEPMGSSFEVGHPANANVAVDFTFDASSAIARQVEAGARIDVVATADRVDMDDMVAAGQVVAPRPFARNRMAVIVEPGNPKDIRRVADLARDDIVLVACAPEVPCGRLASQLLARAKLDTEPASFEENVKSVVAKVRLGEADAGIVYETDAKVAGARVELVAFPDEPPFPDTTYFIAVTEDVADPDLAEAWVAYVLSPDAVDMLTRAGFLQP